MRDSRDVNAITLCVGCVLIVMMIGTILSKSSGQSGFISDNSTDIENSDNITDLLKVSLNNSEAIEELGIIPEEVTTLRPEKIMKGFHPLGGIPLNLSKIDN